MNTPIIEKMMKQMLPSKWKRFNFLLLYSLAWEPLGQRDGLVEEHPAIVSYQKDCCFGYSAIVLL